MWVKLKVTMRKIQLKMIARRRRENCHEDITERGGTEKACL